MAAQENAFPRFERGREDPNAGYLHMQLRAGAQAAGEGRHALDRLEGTLKSEQLDELRLLVSELLTNSVRHGARGEGWITLDVGIEPDSVRVVVTDRGSGFEPEDEPRPHIDRPGGWGLCLVNRIADRWGVRVNGSTSVWFEVERAGLAAAV